MLFRNVTAEILGRELWPPGLPVPGLAWRMRRGWFLSSGRFLSRFSLRARAVPRLHGCLVLGLLMHAFFWFPLRVAASRCLLRVVRGQRAYNAVAAPDG